MTPKEAIRRHKELEKLKSNWSSYWQELASWCLPRKAYITQKRTSGQQLDNSKIFDNSAIVSVKIMAAGFHSHLTNPSSRWFEFAMKNRILMEDKLVKIWFKDVEDAIFGVLNTSNFDSVMQEFYLDAGVFGTGAIFEEEDLEDKVRFTTLPLGEIDIEEDSRGRVNKIYRKFTYTAIQAFERWGEDAGLVVTKAIAEKQFQKEISILHWIAPREIRQEGKEDSLNKKWESVWIETTLEHKISESGFYEFPVAVGRFTKETGEKWGYSPAMDVLPDIRMINAQQKTLIRGAMKIVDPPVIVPSRGFTVPLNLNPSGINYSKPGTPSDAFQPMMTKGNVPIGMEMVEMTRKSIEEGFYVPLFKAFSQITKTMTIPEVQRRISENMVLLGPVVGRFTQEILDVLLIRTFLILLRNGAFPPPPSVIEGQEFDIVYISTLAKAQRNSEIVSLTNTLETIGGISQFIPSVLHKVDGDKAADIVADINGTNPELLRDEKEVKEIRDAIAEAEAQAAQTEQLAAGAGIAKDAASAKKDMVAK